MMLRWRRLLHSCLRYTYQPAHLILKNLASHLKGNLVLGLMGFLEPSYEYLA